MDKAGEGIVFAWFEKASHDLDSAKKLGKEPDPYFDTAIYHCQQAAEKAVKAFLVFHDQPIDKTHNIAILIEKCMRIDQDFDRVIEAGEILTPYATAFRYPPELIQEEPDKSQFQEALRLSQQIVDCVKSKIPFLTRAR